MSPAPSLHSDVFKNLKTLKVKLLMKVKNLNRKKVRGEEDRCGDRDI